MNKTERVEAIEDIIDQPIRDYNMDRVNMYQLKNIISTAIEEAISVDEKILSILDNITYWETCPKEYKEIIKEISTNKNIITITGEVEG